VYKRIISILLVALAFSFCFTSCRPGADEGQIKEVEIESPDEEVPETGSFTKMESPYDYEYESFSIKKAHMKFDVPKSWDSKLINSRYARLEIPPTDDLFPGCTINILCGYGEDVDENEMSEYTLNNHAYKFSDFFSYELEGLQYTVEGHICRLREYVTEDHIVNGLPFVDDDHVEDAATLIADDVVLVDKATHYYSGYSLLCTAVKWDHRPFCFSMIVPKESAEGAEKMLEYIASSISYVKSDNLEFGEVSYGDIFTSVPTHFMPVTGAENIFASPLDQNRETAGMALGVFRIDDKETITEENIARYYGETIATYAYDGYGVPAQYAAKAYASSEGPDFTGEISINSTGADAASIAGSVFGPYSLYKADYYVKEDGDAAYLVAMLYQQGQEKIAKKVGETALRKLRIN